MYIFDSVKSSIYIHIEGNGTLSCWRRKRQVEEGSHERGREKRVKRRTKGQSRFGWKGGKYMIDIVGISSYNERVIFCIS